MTAPTETAAPIPAEERLWWFLFVLNACGDHGSYANDDPGEWVAAFCDDVEPTDTFNRACDLKLATCTHNSMDETSRVWITEAGKRFLADRASQEERIREDERGLRGKIVYPCARFRNDNEFRDPNGYVIVKAERAAASEGRPEPKYYTLVSDTGDVRTLLSTLFTRDPDRARLRGDAS